jgi:hypothetical protein
MGKSGVAVLAFVLGAGLAGAGSATAARLITGKDIKNGSITAKDLSKGVNAQLQRTGEPGPKGDPGPQGDPGASEPSLLTFADSAVTPAIELSGPDAVVTSTQTQLPNASGAVGGPLILPGGPGKYVMTSTVRVKTQGGGSYACALQASANGGNFFDIERVEGVTTDVLRFVTPSGSFLNNAAITFQFRIVCNDGAGTRTVTDADLGVIGAVQR